MFRKAFTLMEINLAIMIIAGGLLASVSLFSLGYSESAHANEDAAIAAYSEEIIGRLALAIGDRNTTWETFNQLGDYPNSDCWAAYMENDGTVISNPESKARGVFETVMGKFGKSQINANWPTKPSILSAVGLVVTHDRNSPVVKIGVRASRKPQQLLASSMYFTEVVFQGRD